MPHKARFGEHILSCQDGNPEPRWKRGVRIGTIEYSDGHLGATELGVIKCRATTSLPEGQRLSEGDIELIRGIMWKALTRHIGSKIRMHIPECEDDEEGEEPEGDDAHSFHVQADEYPQADEIIKRVSDAQKMLETRIGQKYTFYAQARHVTKCMPTPDCPGGYHVT